MSPKLSRHIHRSGEMADGYNPSPALTLLATHLQARPGQATLLINVSPDILAAGLADRLQGTRLEWMGRDQTALALAEQSLLATPEIRSRVWFEIDLPTEYYGQFDLVALLNPKSRDLARRWVLTAYLALKPGGSLYLAGPNDLGIRSIIKDAEDLFSPATILGYKKGNRLARLHKPAQTQAFPNEPVWLTEPGLAPGSWQTFQFDWRGSSWEFSSLPGVFSSDRLDDGTRLLLDHLSLPQGARVLDFGCGSGVIGVLAALHGAATVDLIDNDLLAIASARKNIAERDLSNAFCVAGDGLGPVAGRRYTHILSNPPFHSGKAISYLASEDFIAASPQHLEKTGTLILVANRFIPYEQSLQRYYRKIARLAEDNRYQVLAATHPVIHTTRPGSGAPRPRSPSR